MLMNPKRLTPILNVSNIEESFAWFEKLGWEKAWAWDCGGLTCRTTGSLQCSRRYELGQCLFLVHTTNACRPKIGRAHV